MDFKDWLAQRIADRNWGVAEAAGHIGVSHSMVSRYLNGKAKPERKTIRALATAFGIERDELEAMLDTPKVPARLQPGFDNIEVLNPDDYTPEEAALIARVLGGVATVFRAKARGEA